MLDVQSSVIDQDIDRAELFDNPLPEKERRLRVRQIGSEGGMPAARKTCQARVSGIPVIAVMNRNARSALCQLHGDDSTDAARGAGHECHGREARARRLAPSLS
jgi:hypothetical protein